MTSVSIHCFTLFIASSVDAERSFSGGRLQVGHLQHNLSSQTFKAKVALGSWDNTPFFPASAPFEILQQHVDNQKARESANKSRVATAKRNEVIVVDE